MNRYRIIKKKAFESLEKFESRMNSECGNGWRIVNLCSDNHTIYVLLERERR
jgi:hypothetical protein